MPIYHIVLFRLKPGIPTDKINTWKLLAKQLKGKIPGLIELHTNTLVPATAARAKGFDMALVAILESMDDILSYAKHPAHLEVHEAREQICDETIAFDIEV
ncbi:stress responsive A/B barrel domain protein [Cadophora sp. DSE1049]|nr:stress responsive A/B barrel domain protein [Cadophora sp. DSE1049]